MKLKKYSTIPYCQEDHGSFDEEWLPHKGATGWWYATGYLNDVDNPQDLYSFQFTLAKIERMHFTFFVSMIAFTDVQTQEHFYHQKMKLLGKITATEDEVSFLPYLSLNKESDPWHMTINTDKIQLDLQLQKAKDAVWHADNGVLIMGLPDDTRQRTVYYSYTNMPTEGTCILKKKDAKELKVKGKVWFDRQYGTYDIPNADTHWEWFSFRFFDDEEVMLFSFPQHPYQDGTYIDKEGNARLIRDYEIVPDEIIEVDGIKFSNGWTVTLPNVKEGHYKVMPIVDGHIDLVYFELLAEVLNDENERVGYCVVELLPGVRNPDGKGIGFRNLVRKT